MSGVLDHLPPALRGAVRGDYAAEPRADCARCPMTTPRQPWSFDPTVRCCSYHPPLANVLAGRALRRGGVGAERVRARLSNPGGVSPWGIIAPPGWLVRYHRSPDAFGHDPRMRCPYWVGGEHACGLWADRPGVCRSWYCIHGDGNAGAERWGALADVLSDFEQALGVLLVELGEPDAHPSIADWYLWCAERADTLTDAELAPVIEHARASLDAEQPEPAATPRPTRARPAVGQVHGLGDDVGLTGYSPYDVVIAPRSVFGLLSRLSGGADLDTSVAEAGTAPALVDELVRIGAIEPAD